MGCALRKLLCWHVCHVLHVAAGLTLHWSLSPAAYLTLHWPLVHVLRPGTCLTLQRLLHLTLRFLLRCILCGAARLALYWPLCRANLWCLGASELLGSLGCFDSLGTLGTEFILRVVTLG